MKISLMNHQDAGEPDPSASGVTGTGQKYERKTGIVEHKLPRDAGKFSRYSGCTGTIPAEQVPEEFFLPENSGFHPGISGKDRNEKPDSPEHGHTFS
jgi:hypothetical protein